MIPMIRGDTGPSELDHFSPGEFERSEIEFPLAVVPALMRGGGPRLETVSADGGPGLAFAHEEMIADFIELVLVDSSGEGAGQAFVQFKVEDFVAQALGRAYVVDMLGERKLIPFSGDGKVAGFHDGRREKASCQV